MFLTERDKLGRFIGGYTGSPIQKGHKMNVGRVCSEETRRKIGIANSKPKIKVACQSCTKVSNVWPARAGQQYCSRSCSDTGSRGKPSWNKGLKGYRAGKQHHNWQGGITGWQSKIRESLEYKEWRKLVFERDDYTCQECGQKGFALQADHIKSFALFPDLRLSVDNGRTLCKSCHLKTDNWGRKGKTLKSLQEICS